MKHLICLLIVSVLIIGGAPGFAQATLRPGDTVEIRLGGAPLEDVQQFTASYTVDDQGFLNIPYIGQVRVAGMAANAAQLAIQNRLKDDKIFTDPTITILIPQMARFVNVGGAVRAPQRISYTPDLTLMSAINAAGGFNEFANQKNVRLIREGRATSFDTRQIRKDPRKDPQVIPGDQIEVPQSLW